MGGRGICPMQDWILAPRRRARQQRCQGTGKRSQSKRGTDTAPDEGLLLVVAPAGFTHTPAIPLHRDGGCEPQSSSGLCCHFYVQLHLSLLLG